MDFTTEISGWDVMVHNISDKETETESVFTVKWQLYTEMREWGVKEVGVFATEVTGEIEVLYTGIAGFSMAELGKEEVVKTEKITSDENGWELETNTDNIEWGNTIKPQDLEIDFKSKTITVIF